MHDISHPEPIRGSAVVTSENRGFVRKWIRSQGGFAPGSIERLSLAELQSIYNDTTDAVLNGTRDNPAPVAARIMASEVNAPADLAQRLADTFAQLAASQVPSTPPLDEDRVIELVKEHSAPSVVIKRVEIVVTKGEEATKLSERQHYLFPLCMAVANATLPDGHRVPLMLVGAKGSGKSRLAKSIAKARGLGYEEKSFCQQSPESSVLGYMSADGTYIESSFHRAFKAGECVFHADEFDAANPNVALALNNGTANGGMGFPYAYVNKGLNFWQLASANLWGNGANGVYSGRTVMDDSTLDRYACLAFPYDEGLEAEICGIVDVESPECDVNEGGTPSANEWLAYVQKARKAWSALGVDARGCPSPRASIYGIALAKAGIGRAWLERMLIWRGLDTASIAKVKGAMR